MGFWLRGLAKQDEGCCEKREVENFGFFQCNVAHPQEPNTSEPKPD